MGLDFKFFKIFSGSQLLSDFQTFFNMETRFKHHEILDIHAHNFKSSGALKNKYYATKNARKVFYYTVYKTERNIILALLRHYVSHETKTVIISHVLDFIHKKLKKTLTFGNFDYYWHWLLTFKRVFTIISVRSEVVLDQNSSNIFYSCGSWGNIFRSGQYRPHQYLFECHCEPLHHSISSHCYLPWMRFI